MHLLMKLHSSCTTIICPRWQRIDGLSPIELACAAQVSEDSPRWNTSNSHPQHARSQQVGQGGGGGHASFGKRLTRRVGGNGPQRVSELGGARLALHLPFEAGSMSLQTWALTSTIIKVTLATS